MKNTFYLMSKGISVLKTFIFFLWLLGYVEKLLNIKAMVNFKIHDVTD